MMTSSCDTHAHKTHHRRGGGWREREGGVEGGRVGGGRVGGVEVENSSTKIPPKQTGVRIGTNLNDTPIRSVPSH